MFLSFKEKSRAERTHYHLPPDMSFAEAKKHGSVVISSKLDSLVPLVFSRAVGALHTSSGLIVSRIYLSSDHRLVWDDTDPDKLTGDMKKEMVRVLGFRSVNEYERHKMKSRGFDYYDYEGY